MEKNTRIIVGGIAGIIGIVLVGPLVRASATDPSPQSVDRPPVSAISYYAYTTDPHLGEVRAADEKAEMAREQFAQDGNFDAFQKSMNMAGLLRALGCDHQWGGRGMELSDLGTQQPCPKND